MGCQGRKNGLTSLFKAVTVKKALKSSPTAHTPLIRGGGGWTPTALVKGVGCPKKPLVLQCFFGPHSELPPPQLRGIGCQGYFYFLRLRLKFEVVFNLENQKRKISPKTEVFGRTSLRTSGQKLRTGPPNPGKKTSILAWTCHADVHEKTSV